MLPISSEIRRQIAILGGLGAITFLAAYLTIGINILWQADDFFDSRENCGTGPAPSVFFSSDFVSLNLENNSQGKATISGYINLSQKTFEKLNLDTKKIHLRLEPLQENSMSIPINYEELTVGSWNKNFDSSNMNAYADLQEKDIRLIGDPKKFPYDEYKYGYKAVAYTLENGEPKDLKIEYVFTIAQLSSTFIPRVVSSPSEYMKKIPDSFFDMSNRAPYTHDECAIIIERKNLFKCLVWLLTAFLFFPALYTFFKTEAQPGIDLIATVVSVAAIRYFLIGPVEDFTFYRIDFFFGLAIVLAATLPLLLDLGRKINRSK